MVDLVTGGKASASLLHDPTIGTTGTVEIVLKLCSSDHVSMVQESLEFMDIDQDHILGETEHRLPLLLSLKRSLVYTSTAGKYRVKSICYINDKQVPLKVLKGIGGPLLPVVNAPLAANALGRAPSRLAMIDASVSSDLLASVNHLSKLYKNRRRERESLERELGSRTLPVSMIGQDDKNVELLRHWIHELSGFEARIRELIVGLTGKVRVDTESDLSRILDELGGLDWFDDDNFSTNRGFSSSMYRCLLQLSNQLTLLDAKVEACVKARESLGSLSSPNSARTALERTRRLLLDVGEELATDQSKVMAATEKAHEMLNHVEMALTECANFLDDEDNGLLSVLQSDRNDCSMTSEKLGEYILEWNTLARKHGISPYLLPSCHRSLREELDGNVEAQTLLPKALTAEKETLAALEQECHILSKARSDVAARLSESVSKRLPSLGMDSKLAVHIRQPDYPIYSSGLGVDEVDFFLFQEDDGSNNVVSAVKRGGPVESVASAGEKARILLAIECEAPGSIRALCEASSGSSSNEVIMTNRPVAVIYDEIDAHIGGRASVSVARMLLKQSEYGQVVSITHSPSVAATADVHICVQKETNNGQTMISASPVVGPARLKELARMASGDMAMEEAEAFAEALIRDSTLSRGANNKV